MSPAPPCSPFESAVISPRMAALPASSGCMRITASCVSIGADISASTMAACSASTLAKGRAGHAARRSTASARRSLPRRSTNTAFEPLSRPASFRGLLVPATQYDRRASAALVCSSSMASRRATYGLFYCQALGGPLSAAARTRGRALRALASPPLVQASTGRPPRRSFVLGVRMGGDPVARDVDAPRDPDIVVRLHIVDEARAPRCGRGGRSAGNAGRSTASSAHRDRGITFRVQHVEGVLQVRVELLAAVETLRRDETHVVGVERVGHDQQRRGPRRVRTGTQYGRSSA